MRELVGPMKRLAGSLAAAALAVLAGLHFLWATGSSWPAKDAGTISGGTSAEGEVPGPFACISVGALLALASSFVGGLFQNHWIGRSGRFAVAVALMVRGIAGVGGKTGRLVGRPTSEEFDHLDRRRYGPLCLILAVLILLSRP
ncbi:MAG: DUF3995 domain-containing protein [Solirubrobacterales bacterium]